MKKLTKHLSYIAVILIIFVIGFASGLVRGRDAFAQSINDVDLTEFWRVWEIIGKKYVSQSDPITDEVLVQGAIKGLVDSLDDPYSVYFDKEENEVFREAIDGNFEGVGMEVGIADGYLTVVAPLKNTPAEKSGLLTGDIIVKIDGVDSAGMTVDEAVSKIRGPVGTEVVLSIYRPETEEEMDISVKRDVIKVPVLNTKYLADEDVFVIELYNFTGSIDDDFKVAINEFKNSGSNKLVLDLRGNPGGFLDAAIGVSSYFLPKGTVVVREDFGNDKNRALRSTGYGYLNNDELQVVILANGGSASASEIVAGALSEHGVAKIVGTKTFGKGSVQELIKTSEDTALKITVARWLTPNGISISENGLEPDFEVEAARESASKGIDLQLEKALEILK